MYAPPSVPLAILPSIPRLDGRGAHRAGKYESTRLFAAQISKARCCVLGVVKFDEDVGRDE